MLSIGGGGLLNEVVWHYTGGGRSKTYFSRKHDVLFWYRKTKEHVFNIDSMRVPYKETSGYAKSGITSKSGKQYLPHPDGTPVDDVWDIPIINPMSKERMGYPTQKPLLLLERIIKASSNPDDIVLDPFCGCGTTVEAAKILDRQFVGIDISSFAIDLVRDKRLKDPSIPVYGIPYDLRSAEKLAGEKPFDFESWAITRLPGFVPNTKQVADGGVDGRAYLAETPKDLDSKLALAQVKGGKFSLSGLRDFIGVTKRDQAALGCYVTLRPVRTKSAKMEMISTGKIQVGISSYPRMQIWSIKDYFDDCLPRLPMMNDPYTGKAMLPQLFL